MSVELSVEFPVENPRFCLRGNSTGKSTILCRVSWMVPKLESKLNWFILKILYEGRSHMNSRIANIGAWAARLDPAVLVFEPCARGRPYSGTRTSRVCAPSDFNSFTVRKTVSSNNYLMDFMNGNIVIKAKPKIWLMLRDFYWCAWHMPSLIRITGLKTLVLLISFIVWNTYKIEYICSW